MIANLHADLARVFRRGGEEPFLKHRIACAQQCQLTALLQQARQRLQYQIQPFLAGQAAYDGEQRHFVVNLQAHRNLQLALKRMLAMRHFKRAETVDGVTDTRALEEVGLTEAQAQEMYRYLAIANYEDRFVVPSSHRELAREAFPEKNGCGFTFGDGCHGSDSKFNLFNSRRIDAVDVTSKTEPHQ